MSTKSRAGTRRGQAPEWFRCVRCGQPVSGQAVGTSHRNHCPWCLWSRHLDDVPGDRASGCRGSMEPIAVWVRPGGEWAIIHRCRSCGELHSNRVAGDDNELALMALAVRAMSQPPFPLERLLPEVEPDHEDWPAALACRSGD
ncbi:MAG: RNHCP domain-containing protein [Armatimonadota bacterium]